MSERLYRSNDERMLLGVCGGIAERWGVDPTLVRLAFVAAFFLGPGLLAYIACFLVVPRAKALPASPEYRAFQITDPVPARSHGTHVNTYR